MALLALPLTVEALVLGVEGDLERASLLLDQALEVHSTQVGQLLLHLTGAAGVALRADTQVLACEERGRDRERGGGEERRRGLTRLLNRWLHFSHNYTNKTHTTLKTPS